MQDLYSTDPIQETYALDQAGYATHTRQHELDHTDHTDHTDQERISLPCLEDLGREL